jgi:dUTPase
MNIPFKVKLLTDTAKAPTQENEGDLWDLYADNFCCENLKDQSIKKSYTKVIKDRQRYMRICHISFPDPDPIEHGFDVEEKILYDGGLLHIGLDYIELLPQGRILIKTGIAVELPIHTESEIRRQNIDIYGRKGVSEISVYDQGWQFNIKKDDNIVKYAVADIRPRSGLALKHGITVLNTPGTIDNSYRKEIGVILYNAGHEPYTISKGDKISQMLIRPLYPSKMEIVKSIEDTQRGGYGSTGK